MEDDGEQKNTKIVDLLNRCRFKKNIHEIVLQIKTHIRLSISKN